MTVTLQQTSVFNIEASIGASFVSFVATVAYPSWLAQPAVIVIDDEDETVENNAPCFSLAHIPVSSEDRYQGRQGGGANTTRETALIDVSAWVFRNAAKTWTAQLRTMEDIAKHWANRSAGIVVRDYAANLAAPAATNYLVRLTGAESVETQHDPNPALERRRVLVRYQWHYQA